MDIYTYGDGDFLSLILKATAAGFQGGGMMALLKMAAMFGMLFAIAQASISGQASKTTGQLFTTMIIVMGLIAPVMTVRVVDTTQIEIVAVNQEDHVIKGVPIGIGLPASIASTVGYFLAKSFEDQFTTIKAESGRFTYSQTGLMFAQAALEANMKQKIRDPRTVRNMNHFWKNCVFYDIHFGLYSELDLFKTTNVLEFLGNTTSAARSFTYITAAEKTPTIVGCKAGWPDLAKDITEELDKEDGRLGDFLIHKMTGNRFNPKYNGENITFAQTAQQSMAIMGLAASAEGGKTAQAMLYNSLKAGTRNLAGETDSGTLIQNIAISQGQREQRMSLSNAGIMARRYIPMLKNIADAVLFAIAPIIFVLAMFGNGFGVLSHYAKAMFAFSLWPVMFSVLNVIMIYKTKAALVAAGVATGDGLRFYAISLVPEVLQDQAALAGGLCLAIPTLSFAIVYGGGSAFAGSLGALTGSGQASAANTANSMSKGDFSMANQSYGNVTANQQKFSPMYDGGSSSVSVGDGVTSRDNQMGQLHDVAQSSLPISARSENSQSSKLAQSRSLAQSQMTKAEQSMQNDTRQALSETSKLAEGLLSSDKIGSEGKQAIRNALSFTQGHNTAQTSALGHSGTMASTSSLNANIGAGLNRGASGGGSGGAAPSPGVIGGPGGNANALEALAGGQPGQAAGFSTPGGSKLGAGIGVAADIRGTDAIHSSKGLTDSHSSGNQQLDAVERLDSVARQVAQDHNVSVGNESTSAISKARASTDSFSKAASQVETLNQQAERAESNSVSVSSNDSNGVVPGMVAAGGNNQDIRELGSSQAKRDEVKGLTAGSANAPADVSGGHAAGDMQFNGTSSSQFSGDVQSDIGSGHAAAGAALDTSKHDGKVLGASDAYGEARWGQESDFIEQENSQLELGQEMRKENKPVTYGNTKSNLRALGGSAPRLTRDIVTSSAENAAADFGSVIRDDKKPREGG